MGKSKSRIKKELVDYCKSLGIDPKGKTKKILLEEVEIFKRKEIEESKKKGTDNELLYTKIEELSNLNGN